MTIVNSSTIGDEYVTKILANLARKLDMK